MTDNITMCIIPDFAAVSAWCVSLAFGLTLLALASGIYFVFNRLEKIFKTALFFLGGAVLFQAAAFAALTLFFWYVPENRYLTPVNTSRGMVLALGFCINALLLGLEMRRGTGITFVFVLPWSLLLLAITLFSAAPGLEAFSLQARSPLSAVHNFLFMVSYAMFINAFGASFSLLLSDRELRGRIPHEAAFALPSIGDMDRLIWRLVEVGFPLFSAGFILASIQLYAKYSRLPGSDVKELGAIATLLVYGIYLVLRKYGDWRGTKAAWANVAGFIFIAATMVLSSRLIAYHKFF
ncbi:MAG: cytochrome c biogenesis protein CcsA [Elusimicrobiota bacterium]|nr:cytochrome c biogenesis protein CcsA [Elusimicrobiota bacterium]